MEIQNNNSIDNTSEDKSNQIIDNINTLSLSSSDFHSNLNKENSEIVNSSEKDNFIQFNSNQSFSKLNSIQMDYQINNFTSNSEETLQNYEKNDFQHLQTPQPPNKFIFTIKKYTETRYQIIFLSFIVILISYADRTNISTAIVDMKEKYGWDETKVGIILSAFYYGYTFNQIPGSYIARKLGGQLTLFLALGFYFILFLFLFYFILNSLLIFELFILLLIFNLFILFIY